MPDADERLLVEAAQHDPSKFADLYERYFERVYAFVVSRVRDRDAAEDVTADVFHKALANLRQFQWRGIAFGAWLIRIAANTIADRFERRATSPFAADELADVAAPAIDLDRADRCARLFRLVDALPAEQRRVVVERFVEERSIREIAQRLDKTEGAIKQLQFRALQSLRARMEVGDV